MWMAVDHRFNRKKNKKENTMVNKEALCKKIREIYPDIGECGIDVNVEFDESEKTWVVHLKSGKKELKTFLEPKDADQCMEGNQCVSLGIEINQLKDSIERMPAR